MNQRSSRTTPSLRPWLALPILALVVDGGTSEAGHDDGAAARTERLARQKEGLAALGADTGVDHQRWMKAAADCIASAGDGRLVRGAEGWFARHDMKGLLAWNAPAPDAPEFSVAQRRRTKGHPFEGVVDFALQLRERGVEMLFVPVPSRAHVYPDELIDMERLGEDFQGHAPGVLAFLRMLTRFEVEAVDLTTPLARERAYDEDRYPLFLRHDGHWSPRGARIAAREVGRRVLAIPGIDPGPLQSGQDYFVRRSKPLRAPGDPEGVHEVFAFEQVVDPEGAAFDPLDRTSPIMVIGDSFVKFNHGNGAHFPAFLAAETGHKVDIIGSPGGGRKTARQTLRLRGDGLKGKKVVIWLLAARCLAPDPRWAPLRIFR